MGRRFALSRTETLALLAITSAFSCARRQEPPAPAPSQLPTHVRPGELVGLVVDAVTGKPVRFAQVQVFALPDTSHYEAEAVTDAHGRFVVRALGAGVYHVRVRFIGYCPRQPIWVRMVSDSGAALVAAIRPAPCTWVSSDVLSCRAC